MAIKYRPRSGADSSGDEEVSVVKVQVFPSGVGPLSKVRMLMRSTTGFSLVECLIANALVMAMVAAIAVTSASAMSAVQRVAARSDQSLRLAQLQQFLDAELAHARMPQAWVAGEAELGAVTAWPAPADPCQSPTATGPRNSWGGLTIIELSEAPCLPGSATGKALYLELIHPCLTDCDDSSGYRLWPAECHMSDGGGVVPTGPWRVDWQDPLVVAATCTEGAMWGRLERMVLSHRDVAGEAGAPELRLHALAHGPLYRWTQAEVLVSGVGEWDLQSLVVPDITAEERTPLADEALMETRQTPWLSVIQLMVSIEPSVSRVDLPSMRSVRLLIPPY